jgi:hypothetical protein
MQGTSVINLKGRRDDQDFADVVYVGRAMHRGGWQLPCHAAVIAELADAGS